MEINRAGKPATSHAPSAGAELSQERLGGPLRATALCRIFAFAVLLGAGQSTALAQQIQPTAEQMQMINQLPPAQRQQAMDALRQFQERQRQGLPGQDTQLDAEKDREPVTQTQPGAFDILEPEIPRAEGNTSLVLSLTPKVTLRPQKLTEIDEDKALSRNRGSHYYRLDNSGVLHLPGLTDISLLGLTAGEIEQRLGAEPSLALFDVAASILSSETVGAAALKPFGYDLFESMEVEFTPQMSGPVPPDYVVGAGDRIRVQLFGNVNNTYDLEVSRDGALNVPELGPINVAGLRFSEVRADIDQRVKQMLIGTQVSITMGTLRTIRVFVVGDVVRPGSYVVSSLATISSALYRSDGISEVGSLRDIQLKRQGNIVSRLDLYDLLLSGDTSDDHQLQQGDAIFVPPIGSTVGVGGAVRRPAIYETTGTTTVAQVLNLAGGLAPDAFPQAATLERINAGKQRSVLSVNVASAEGSSLSIRNGDTLMVPQVLEELTDTVVLKGHAQRPGPREWRSGMRVTDLIPSMAELKPGADSNYILVQRRTPENTTETLSADLEAALAMPQSAHNIRLESRDTVHVFDLAFGRQRVIKPILDELKLQSSHDASYREVRVLGSVRAPGAYPLHDGMRVTDLLRAGGRLAEEAYILDAELTRFHVVGDEYREKEIVKIDLDAALRGSPEANLVLTPYDHLNIGAVPRWNSDWSVSLEGEVRFPGEYQIRYGETLSDLIERAGGLTDAAFPEGAIFLREELKEREREQLDALARRMESDLASLSLQSLEEGGGEALTVGQSLLNQLRTTEPVGRLVIDVEQVASGISRARSANDVELRDGDRVLVPVRSQGVMVLGEVQYPASHLYMPNLTRDDYISQSGGLTRRADEKLTYIVRASGSVESGGRSRWFQRDGSSNIRPGDTIVIPLDTDRMRPLTFWANVTQILYQGAIAVAAVRTFDN
jgi:protein involved in polysaccharide export with SLBB domain